MVNKKLAQFKVTLVRTITATVVIDATGIQAAYNHIKADPVGYLDLALVNLPTAICDMETDTKLVKIEPVGKSWKRT